MGEAADPLAQIQDPTVRRFVRVVVHVRRFLPFYVTGVVFAVTMAVVPAIGGGDVSGTPSALAGPGGGAGSATGSAGAPAGSRTAASAATGAGGGRGTTAATFLDDALDGSPPDAGGVATAPGATVVDRRTGVDPLAGTPASDVDADDLDDAPDVPEPCRLEPPAPAPAVDPVREVAGAQRTLEAATGQTLPADAGATVSPATDPVVCDAPEPPVEAPSVPLPATPVSTDSADAAMPFGWLLRFVELL